MWRTWPVITVRIVFKTVRELNYIENVLDIIQGIFCVDE